VTVHDKTSGKTVLQFDDPSNYNSHGATSSAVWQTDTVDFVHWSPAINISDHAALRDVNLGTAHGAAQTPDGTMFYTGYVHNRATNVYETRVWSSSLNGSTWLSPAHLVNGSEPQILSHAGGLYVIARNNLHSGGRSRLLFSTKDNGRTFSAGTNIDALVDPGCEGAAVVDANGAVYVSGPGSETERVNITVWRNVDITSDPSRWEVVATPDPDAPAAYSALTALGDAQIGLAWETGAVGCVGASCRVVYRPLAA